ncbi:MAG: carboxypeptidase-like regulatory domain-containing protein [Ignavibacteriaceae bacterium]
MKSTFITFVLFFAFFFVSFPQTGMIIGRVTDSKTYEPLIGANVLVIELNNVGAASDLNGNFRIKVPVGSYSVKVSLIGYTSVVKTDVIIRTGSEALVNIKLAPTSLELDEVTVRADYFDKSVIENDLSTITLGPEEIRRSPGSSQDFQRILQAMPGVSFSNDQDNELLVRGGAPHENLTIFDNIEVHSTNHYPNEMNSGGPINMVNVDLIEDIQFSTGGFISKYGDKLSSALILNTREGSRYDFLKMNVNLSMAGFGAIGEGKIDGGKGSWLFSARKSYINLIAGSFGLTSIPYYYDVQFKFAYDLSGNHKLSWSGIYGNDKIDIEGVPDKTNLKYANSSDSLDVENVAVKMNQYATGISLKSLWSNNFYSIITLSTTNYHDDIDVKYDYTERIYDSNGKVTSTNVLNKRHIFNNYSDNGTTDLKADLVYNLLKNYELDFGGAYRTGRYKQTAFISADTSRYDILNDGVFDIFVVQPNSEFSNDYKLFQQFKSYFYVNNRVGLFSGRLLLNIGGRFDYFSFSKKGNFSPRLSASYYLIQDISTLSFSYGEYYQTQSYPIYGDRYNTKINQFLENSHSRHFVLGYEHILNEGLKINIEGYFKEYSKIPVNETFINFYDRTIRSDQRFTIGQRKIYGVDLLIQQKLVKDIYGTVSFSRMWSETKDPRTGFENKTYPGEYDFPYVVNIIVGKRFRDLRSEINKLPLYLIFPTYILPFSDDMEISLRWRFASGKSYTPREFSVYEQHRQGGTKWTSGTWVATDRILSERYPDYHRLDLGFNSRYNFSSWSLSLFLSIQNLYNRKNIAFYQYNSDGTIDNVYQFSIMPIGGIEIQF